MCFPFKNKHPLSLEPDGNISISSSLEYLACRKSSIVYGIDDKTVLKEYIDTSDNEDVIERQAYQRLGLHPNIAKYIGTTSNHSIVLERGQVLRAVCENPGAVQIPLLRKVRWLKQIAKGLQYIHKKGIVHADVGCHNVILMEHDRLKIIDFEGCSIDGGSANSCYEWFSYRPSTPKISKQTDIFAYGCMVYEVMTGRPPYEELKPSKFQGDLVEQRYAQNQFPDIEKLPLAEVMHDCWYGTISSMEEAVQILEAAGHSDFKTKVASILLRRKKALILNELP